VALEDFAAEMDRCRQCSYCKWIPFDQMKSWRFAKNCPSVSYYDFNSYSARVRYAVARSLLRGQSGYSDTVRDIVFTCMACGACDVSCKVCRYDLEPLEMVRELKFRLVGDGQRLDAHRAVVESLDKEHNTMLQPRNGRGAWADDLDVPRLFSEKAEVLFHAGCRLSYDKDLQDCQDRRIALEERGRWRRHHGRAGDVLRRQGILDGLQRYICPFTTRATWGGRGNRM
jgi:Fe-S oxidoreductase